MPNPPTNVTAVRVSDTTSSINWNNPSGGFEAVGVYRWSNVTQTWTQVAQFSGIVPDFYSDTSCAANRRFRWRVRTATGSDPSTWAYSNYLQTTPVAPSGCVVSRGSSPASLIVTWKNNAASVDYDYDSEVYESVNGGAYSLVTRPAEGVTSLTRTGLTPGATYQYQVRTRSTVGATTYSGYSTSSAITVYSTPAAVTGLSVTRVSDTSHSLTWTNNPTAAAPYDSVAVHRWDSVSNAWSTIATLAGTAASFSDTSTIANRKYQWRVIATNTSGDSPNTDSTVKYTTPANPTAVSASYSGGTTIRVVWTPQASHADYTTTVRWYKNAVLQAGAQTIASGVGLYDLNGVDPLATYSFEVQTVSTGGLTSAWVASNTVSGAAPPNAPTNLSPTGGAVVDLARVVPLSWVHAPSVDGSAQTKYQIQHRASGSGTWTVASVVTSANNFGNAPWATNTYANGTVVEWQVRTYGIHATAGAWSATATVTGSATPTLTLNSPLPTLLTSQFVVNWNYLDGEGTPQSEYEIRLFDGAGLALIEEKVGTGTTSNLTLDTVAIDGEEYRLTIRVRDGSGLWSDLTTRQISAEFTPPAESILNAELDSESGSMILELSPLSAVTPGTEVRRNRALDPQAANSGLAWWASTRGHGTFGLSTYSWGTGVTPYGNTFRRKTWTTASTGNANSGFDLTTVAVTPGQVVTFSGLLRSSAANKDAAAKIEWRNGSNAVISTTTGTVVTLVANEWTLIQVQGTAPALSASFMPILDVTAGTPWAVGNTLDGTAALIEFSATPGAFFDGTTETAGLYYYEWTSTINGSASVQKLRGSLTPSSATIERRIFDPETHAFGAWETVAANIAPNARIIDTTAPIHADGEYRVTTFSTAPSSYRPVVSTVPVSWENKWLYVNGGPSFNVVCRMWANIELSWSASRGRALYHFAGRAKPVLYSGESTEQTLTVTGLVPDDDGSAPAQWLKLAKQPGAVLLRAPGNRRIFGALSEVSVEMVRPGLHKVSFSIQEVYR